MDVIAYQTPNGRRPYAEWIHELKDRKGSAAIYKRIERLRVGAFGDSRNIGQGLWELRIHFGLGYRIYFIIDGSNVVVLLCGGDKDSQIRDIAKARLYAEDYWREK